MCIIIQTLLLFGMKTLHFSNDEIDFLYYLLTSLLNSQGTDPNVQEFSDDYDTMARIISKLKPSPRVFEKYLYLDDENLEAH